MIRFHCPFCDKRLKTSADVDVKRAKVSCPSCQQVFLHMPQTKSAPVLGASSISVAPSKPQATDPVPHKTRDSSKVVIPNSPSEKARTNNNTTVPLSTEAKSSLPSTISRSASILGLLGAILFLLGHAREAIFETIDFCFSCLICFVEFGIPAILLAQLGKRRGVTVMAALFFVFVAIDVAGDWQHQRILKLMTKQMSGVNEKSPAVPNTMSPIRPRSLSDRSKQLARPAFTFEYPTSWKIDDKHSGYYPDRIFKISASENAMIMFMIRESQIDEIATLEEFVRVHVTQMKNFARTDFTKWGMYSGHGAVIRGREFDNMQVTKRLFVFNAGRHAFIVFEYFSDDEKQTHAPGYKMIEESFRALK